ncbi:MAG: glycosyltransferase [Flavobacteriales bacterium]|nr:glycosyltransferase [Flavobacteriales bacterium]
MLSILIPIYNFDVVGFVKDLSNQASACNIEFKILCFDDGSITEFKSKNQELATLPNVVYTELPQNVGRSKIRNLLAEKAQFEYLLFLDCDSTTNNNQFVRNYIENLKSNTVVYGGRNYANQAPATKETHFRWWYGVNRETISAKERVKQPYDSFMTNNFMISKSLFLSIKLDETLQGYGHEDTLFGIELKKKNIPILHIENPLCHIGLEGLDEFLQKTKEGIQNLHQLIQSGKVDESIKLFRFYKLVNKLGLSNKILKYYTKNKTTIEQKLAENEPNLRWFDIYKLGYLISLTKP